MEARPSSGATTVYIARRIHTMDAPRPEATAVAVRDGRILGVGTPEEMEAYGPATVDRTFADKVLLPGFIEAHGHAQNAGMSWATPYVGFYPRTAPDGMLAPGCRTNAEVLERLHAAEATLPTQDEPLLAWGYDPLFLADDALTAAALDTVSATRPIFVRQASGHLAVANTALLRAAGLLEGDAEAGVRGVLRDAQGRPTGVLQAGAMNRARASAGDDPKPADRERGTYAFAQLANRVGCTTVTDLSFGGAQEHAAYAAYAGAAADPRFPARVLLAYGAAYLLSKGSPAEAVEYLRGVHARDTEKLRTGAVKVFVDGSIQGFTARLNWPGYHNGHANGIFLTEPNALKDVLFPFHAAGLQVHLHTNGDEAIDAALDAIEAALAEAPRWDHRHTLEHTQMATPVQFRRMAALGVCANLFPNHIYYWGDIHAATTLGPSRAARMNAAATALRTGVTFAFHADPGVTPLDPLFSAWVAINRRTASGRVLGEGERIPVADALRAITLGPARLLKLDHELGSIEPGKRADFAVLEDDPLAVAPEALKDVPVWGTVLGGALFPVTSAAISTGF